MLNITFDGNMFSVKFYYEKPRTYPNSKTEYINTHCEVIHKGVTKEVDVVIASSNVERPIHKFVRAATRKLALTKALQRGSVTMADGKQVVIPFFSKEERALIWKLYFDTLNNVQPVTAVE
jgi:hypothetical protein